MDETLGYERGPNEYTCSEHGGPVVGGVYVIREGGRMLIVCELCRPVVEARLVAAAEVRRHG